MKNIVLLGSIVLLLSACAGPLSRYGTQDQGEHTHNIKQPVTHKAVFDHPRFITLQSRYHLWLSNAGIEPKRMALLISVANPSINHIIELEDGAVVEMQFPHWYVAGGKIPRTTEAVATFSDSETFERTIPANFKQPSVRSAVYLGHLYFTRRCKQTNAGAEQAALSLEEYREFHRFLLSEKMWTQQDYDVAEAAVEQIEASVSTNGTTLC